MQPSELDAAVIAAVTDARVPPTLSDIADRVRVDLISVGAVVTRLTSGGQLERGRRNGCGPWTYTLAAPAEDAHSTLEVGMRFALWALPRTVVTVADVIAEFRCSRATAYRYLEHWQRQAGRLRAVARA